MVGNIDNFIDVQALRPTSFKHYTSNFFNFIYFYFEIIYVRVDDSYTYYMSVFIQHKHPEFAESTIQL